MEKFQTKDFYRRLFLVIVTIAGLYFLYRVRIVLLPFLFASFIAYLLNPPIKFIVSRKVPRTTAIILLYLIIFVLINFLVIFAIPRVTEELLRLGRALPRLNAEVQDIIWAAESRFKHFSLPEGIRQVLDERVKYAEELLVNAARAGTTAVVKMFSYLLLFIISPVFAFYMLKDADRIKESLTMTIPRKYRSDVLAIGRDIDEIVSAFLRGHLLISVIVGLLTGLGMYIIGLDFAFIIGLIAAIAELIPYLGPFISAVPTVALALLVSQKTALYALIVIFVVQQLESAVISPRILSRRLGLHPLVIIFSLMAGAELYGFAGVVLAVPAAAAIKVILRYIYLKLVDD